MSQEERFGTRDQTYSAWHRRNSTRRYIGSERAQLLAMIDVDALLYLECDDKDMEPLAVIEVARDVGQANKTATAAFKLGRRADMPAYCVLYTPADAPNPADPDWPDISRFRIRRLWPKPESGWRILTPLEWAESLLRLRAWAANAIDNRTNGSK